MNHKQTGKFQPGIGATSELSLRVSVATLVRVLFKNPTDNELMLSLERRATLLSDKEGRFVEVKCQPFGGAIQILDLEMLQTAIGDFHFDSEQSRDERDFRLFIRPSAWDIVREFCVRHSSQLDDPVLDFDPTRELVEEFADTMKIGLKPDQIVCKPVGTTIENEPSPTDNFYARGIFTTRIYRVFEAQVVDPSLVHALLKNSVDHSDDQLRALALQNAQNGGPGWATTVLTLPISRLTTYYLSTPVEALNQPLSYQGHQLDETIAAILDGISMSKYKRV
jgi:hypothetical protein